MSNNWLLNTKIRSQLKNVIRPAIAAGNVWSNLPNSFELVIDGDFMYVTYGFGNGDIAKVSMVDGSIVNPAWATVPNTIGLGQMVILNDYLYVANFIGNGIGAGPGKYTGTNIVQINLSDGTIANENWCNGLLGPFGLAIVDGYMYSTNLDTTLYGVGNDTIAKIDMTDGSIVDLNWCTGLSLPIRLSQSGNYFYTPTNNGNIAKISITDGSVNKTWVSLSTFTPFIAIYGNYLYIANYDTGDGDNVLKIDLATGTILDPNYFTNLPNLNGIAFSGNQIYVATQSGIYTLPVNEILCFHEDTLILCNGKYKCVKDLRKGDLVTTRLNGLVPIESIGYSKIYNPANNLRYQNRLFKYPADISIGLYEDLILTGCHSVLVDDLTNQQKEDIIDALGRIMVTDQKYRLMAYLDERSVPYELEGVHNIWHFALENIDPRMNYGVYANGLLVETTSIRMMHELSGMELI